MSYAKKYSFQSIGELDDDLREREKASMPAALPVGIKLPLELAGANSEFLKMHMSHEDAIADNFRNMIMTNHGERLSHYDFGANLFELSFELGTEGGDTKAIRRISTATKKYMPYISLDFFEPIILKNEHGLARVGVKITYTIPKLSKKSRMIEVIIYTAG